jgi:hypothetical protein
MLPGIGGTSEPHGRQPRADPAQAIVADHDRLGRSVQGSADELDKFTISLRHWASAPAIASCFEGQCLSHATQSQRNCG